MTVQMKALSDVNHEAIRLLCERIGVVDALRFVGQFSVGHRDHTEARRTMFGHLTLDEIVAEIERRREFEPRHQSSSGNGQDAPG